MNFGGGKSDQKAESLRAKGAQALANGELYDAILKFNKSLCLAERCSKIIATIYASRAEAYFRLYLFDKCLNNIMLAKDEDVSVDKLEALNEMEEKCLNYVFDRKVEYENPWGFFKLSYPANDKLPFVVDCLEVKCDKKFGRYIVTNKPLSVGDILAIEKPFFKILKTDPADDEYPESNLYQYCANCLDDNLMDLIPCSRCSTTMFCSPKCLNEANETFHQYECCVLQSLNETGNYRMSLRCLFDALSICDGSVEELERIMKKSDETSPTVFNFDFSNAKNPENAKNQLTCMLALERRVEVKPKDFSSIFMQDPMLRELWLDHSEFIKKFLERMMQIEILNFHGVKGRSLSRKNPYRSCLGDGGYTFCSLLNHSCCPNTMRIVVQNRMVLIVEKPIKAGEQLFDCYIGDSFYFKSKSSRRKELEDYQFLCECDACEKDFPPVMNGELEGKDKELQAFAQKAYNELRDPKKQMKPEKAQEMAVKYSNVLQKNFREENYPCREIILLQLCIIKCFLQSCKSTISFP